MSALRPSTTKLVDTACQLLVSPWKDIFHAVENDADVFGILDIIGTHPLDVSGIYVDNVQYNFSTLAALVSGDLGDMFALMHAIKISCVTGVPHEDLIRMRPEWASGFWALHVDDGPVFVLSCRKSFRGLAGFICKHLGPEPLKTLEQCDTSGDTALHIAVRRRHWSWAKWLIDQGCDPHRKNHQGESPFLLAAPCWNTIDMFRTDDKAKWYNALHEALVKGRSDLQWTRAMLDAGADVNQPILYDSPIDCLLLFAHHGLDMNLGPLPDNMTPERYRIMYLHGRKPNDWSTVLDAFHEDEWVRFFRELYTGKEVKMPDEFAYNIKRRIAISDESVKLLNDLKQ